jgi:transposase
LGGREGGLERRRLDEVRRVGIDEKSFGAGHSYVSLMTDLEASRVLEVVPDRTKAAADELWQTLTPPQRDKILAVAVEEWLEKLREADLKTSVGAQGAFRRFWEYTYATTAERFFAGWHGWAVRSQLAPKVETGKMQKRHLSGLLSYFRQRVTNAVSEGFNSRIQSIKSAARGFRAFANYRARILFYCGTLDLGP